MSALPRWVTCRLAVVMGLFVVAACSPGGSRAAPDLPTPLPESSQITVDEGVVTDANETSGACVTTYQWSELDGEPAWVPYHFQDSDGKDNFVDLEDPQVCITIAVPGPASFVLPIDDFEPGWYTSCPVGLCSVPFEVQ